MTFARLADIEAAMQEEASDLATCLEEGWLPSDQENEDELGRYLSASE